MRALLILGIAAMLCGCGPDRDRLQTEFAAYRPLIPFYRELASLEAGQRSRVAVLQIGDSHTANDSFSGRMRELMQARFGDGGRGVLPPGIPYAYYRPAVVRVQEEGWDLQRSGRDAGPFGFAGVRQQAGGAASMTLLAGSPDLARTSLELLAQPGGGTLDVVASDGPAQSVSTASEQPALLRVVTPAGPETSSLELRTRADGPVTLLAWSAERDAPGVTWSNLGTVGATVELLQSWDSTMLREEAAQWKPALIVLAFGTNEGFKSTTDMAAYPDLFRSVLRKLREAAPEAAIVVAGPPSAVRASGEPGDQDCPGPERWSVPAKVRQIREIERQVASSEGAFFWDWTEAMGGECAIVAWANTDPPLAARDHVHMLQPGYRRTAEQLFETLMRGRELYQQLGGRS
jgi:lysophospholipase L1-like esterase